MRTLNFYDSMKQFFHFLPLLLLLAVAAPNAIAQPVSSDPIQASEVAAEKPDARDSAFSPHGGTWLNGIARKFFLNGDPLEAEVNDKGEVHYKNHGIYYDYIIVSVLLMAAIAAAFVLGARKVKVRPEAKATAWGQLFEAAVEGFHKYCISVMGEQLAKKYTPLVSAFFFTILFFNWAGMVPGLLAPTSNPNVPFALAIVSFICVHFIAIRETGFKHYVMHYVGEPLWLAPFNIVLHFISELVKPVSLALRLLGNIFGEETVIAQLALLGIAASAALHLPPILSFQLPMMLMGVFTGLLQAVVFSTLVAIYIVIFVPVEGHEAHAEEDTSITASDAVVQN